MNKYHTGFVLILVELFALLVLMPPLISSKDDFLVIGGIGLTLLTIWVIVKTFNKFFMKDIWRD